MGATFSINTESLKMLLIAQKTLKIKTARAAAGDPQPTCEQARTKDAFAQILHISAITAHV